jgi:hypothetical protein
MVTRSEVESRSRHFRRHVGLDGPYAFDGARLTFASEIKAILAAPLFLPSNSSLPRKGRCGSLREMGAGRIAMAVQFLRRRFTVTDDRRLTTAGILGEDDRVRSLRRRPSR